MHTYEKTSNLKDYIHPRAVVRGGAGGALASLEFWVLGKRTERERDILLLSTPPDSKT